MLLRWFRWDREAMLSPAACLAELGRADGLLL
jgi:hypothetical protein